MSFVKWTLVLFSAAEVFAFQSHPSVIGDGIGLDHIMIGLPGNTQAEDVFAKRLGFSVLPENTFPEDSIGYKITIQKQQSQLAKDASMA